MRSSFHLFFFNKVDFSIFDSFDQSLVLTYYADINFFLNDFFLPRTKDFLYPFIKLINMKREIKLSSSSEELIYFDNFKFEDISYDDNGLYKGGNSRRVIIDKYTAILNKLESILNGKNTIEEFRDTYKELYFPKLTYTLTIDEGSFCFYGLVNILFSVDFLELEPIKFIDDIKILTNSFPFFVTHLALIGSGECLHLYDFIYIS